MFKKFVIVAIVLAVFCGFAGNAYGVSEVKEPDIVGIEYVDAILELSELYENGDDVKIEYEIEMIKVEDYWMVILTGLDTYEDYAILGIYDHAPTTNEFEILWANRMTYDEVCERLEELGF